MTLTSALLYSLALLAAVEAHPLDGDVKVASSSSANLISAGLPILFDGDSKVTTEATANAKAKVTTVDDTEGSSGSLARRGPNDISKTYIEAVLNHHNYHRGNHSADDIVWSDDMMVKARRIANTCVYAHKMDQDGGGYGQNIAVGLEAPDIATVISDLFYNGEVKFYDGMYGREPDMSNFHSWGHMSQIVWKNTKAVGCATADCRARPGKLKNWPYDNAFFTVCNYSPPGNYMGQFAANVGSPKTRPTRGGRHHIDRPAIAQAWWPGKNIK